jgi:hypothetical protein
MKCDHRILLDCRRSFALQLAVLHAASGIHAGCLNLDVASVDVKVMVASHLSNLPSRATDAFTLKLIELSSFENAKTGTPAGVCARLNDGSTAEATRQKITNRMDSLFEHENDDGTLRIR